MRKLLATLSVVLGMSGLLAVAAPAASADTTIPFGANGGITIPDDPSTVAQPCFIRVDVTIFGNHIIGACLP